jgi:hypothetical protein
LPREQLQRNEGQTGHPTRHTAPPVTYSRGQDCWLFFLGVQQMRIIGSRSTQLRRGRAKLCRNRSPGSPFLPRNRTTKAPRNQWSTSLGSVSFVSSCLGGSSLRYSILWVFPANPGERLRFAENWQSPATKPPALRSQGLHHQNHHRREPRLLSLRMPCTEDSLPQR